MILFTHTHMYAPTYHFLLETRGNTRSSSFAKQKENVGENNIFHFIANKKYKKTKTKQLQSHQL